MVEGKKKLFSFPVRTRWGTFGLVASKKGLVSVSFPNSNSIRASAQIPLDVRTVFLKSALCLQKYIRSAILDLDKLTFDLRHLSKKQRQMQKNLRGLKTGELRTYGWLAARLGIPRGARAIGQLLKSNPIPVFFPCHRIIRGDGSLGGFSAGRKWKEKLVQHEIWRQGILR